MQYPVNRAMLIAVFIFYTGCSQTEQNTKWREESSSPSTDMAVDGKSAGTAKQVQTAPVTSPERDKFQNINDEMRQEVIGQRRIETKRSKPDVVRKDTVAGNVQLPSSSSVEQGKEFYAADRAGLGISSLHEIRPVWEPVNRENYAHYDDNPVKRVVEHPVSTFSIDVDTGSYTNVRRMLKTGHLPPQDAVRAEELVNYFSYHYPARADAAAPFVMYKEIAPAPWNKDTYLLHIGIKGYELPRQQLPPANLVFLVDVSGSMRSPDKLGLLKSSLKLLTNRLDANDRVSIVVYAGASGMVLEPTAGDQKGRIMAALDRLTAGGSTNGAAGIRLAYAMAQQGYIKDGINRVLLATDGDFNVGTVNIEQLKDLVEEKRKTGIALSTLGFGAGNYNDHLMEQIADIGNGNYAYIDNLNEAQKVLVDEMSSTMLTIAKDVKIQIEFNPGLVAEYRLLGYENRSLKREDFKNDKVDAGDIGAGHTVTAIYEIALTGSEGRKIDPLRYQALPQSETNAREIAFLKLRYKHPDANTSELMEWPVLHNELRDNLEKTTDAFRFSAAVAAFAQRLRGGHHLGDFDYDQIMTLAKDARGEDAYGYRGEFLTLVNLARSLSHPQQQVKLTN